MFESYTQDALQDDMLERVDDKLDTREGSVIFDATAPAAFALAGFYINLDLLAGEVFADTASYYYLIKRAAERGLSPYMETAAILKMEVTPTSTPIALGDRFNLGDLNYIVTSLTDPDNGVYQVECETKGIIGNQQLGELLPIETANELNDMESAELTEVLIPGEDMEDVEDFRERYFESFGAEAFGGNKKDYHDKISAMDGIGGCKVRRRWAGGYNPASMIPSEDVDTWFGQQSSATVGAEAYAWLTKVYGAAKAKLLTVGGTVEVVIINSEYKVPSSTLVNNVQTALDPTSTAGEGDGLAPIDHVVSVKGVDSLTVNVALTLEYKEGYSFAILEDSIKDAIDAYFLELAEAWETEDGLIVRGSRIEQKLLDIEGIVDVQETLLNGSTDNITLDGDTIPVRGTVNG